MKILLTGGAGYIGSHTCVELTAKGYDVVIADNFYNANPIVIDRIEEISGKRPTVYNIDVADKAALDKLFTEQDIDSSHSFCRLQGSRRIGGKTDRILPQQPRHDVNVTGSYACARCKEDRIQLLGDRLRCAGDRSAPRDHADQGLHESLRLDKIYDRTDIA